MSNGNRNHIQTLVKSSHSHATCFQALQQLLLAFPAFATGLVLNLWWMRSDSIQKEQLNRSYSTHGKNWKKEIVKKTKGKVYTIPGKAIWDRIQSIGKIQNCDRRNYIPRECCCSSTRMLLEAKARNKRKWVTVSSPGFLLSPYSLHSHYKLLHSQKRSNRVANWFSSQHPSFKTT